jgi:hypothetical protein
VKLAKPRDEHAGVFLHKGKLLFEPHDVLTSGVHRSSEPVEVLPEDSQDEAVGSVLLLTLARTRHDVPHPTSWSSEVPVVRVAGCRSWTALAKTALFCTVELGPEELEILPTARRLATRSFVHLPSRTIRLPATASTQEFGRAVREALAISAEASET